MEVVAVPPVHPHTRGMDPADVGRADETVLVPEPMVNRYAVPLTTLVGGAFVDQADHVVIHPQPAAEDVHVGASGAGLGDGADGD